MARIFTDRCYAAVAADPTKSVFQIWKDIRTDMGQHLTPENRESFLSEIPRLHSIRTQLYNHRRKFIPRAPQNFVSFKYIIYSINYKLSIIIIQGDFDRNLPNFFDGLEIGDTTLRLPHILGARWPLLVWKFLKNVGFLWHLDSYQTRSETQGYRLILIIKR